mgnify:CR=1 FL=1
MKVKTAEDAEIMIQKLPCDMGIHRNPRKGTLNAPGEILDRFEPEENILVDEVFPDEFDLEETHERMYQNTLSLSQYGKPVLSVGGDHSVSFPVIRALKEENPDMKLVWLDAHLDLKEKVEGNVSHDVVVRELLNKGFSEDEIVFVGVTEVDADEDKFLEEHDIQIYHAEEVPQFLDNYNPGGKNYLSIDIDVLNESEAPGTGYPDGQLSMQQVEKVVEKVSPQHADIVEVAPTLDNEGKTVKNAVDVLGKLVKQITG